MAELKLEPSEAVGIFCRLAHQRDLPALEMWALAGADFNAADYDLRTPLHIAADEGFQEIVELLVAHGAVRREIAVYF